MNKKVYVVTDVFPYGFGEYTFLLDELIKFCEKGYKVTIISGGPESKIVCEDFLKKYDIDVLHYTYTHTPFSLIYGTFATISSSVFHKELRLINQGKQEIKLRKKKTFWFIFHSLQFKKWLQKCVSFDEEALFYTYWYYEKTLALSLIKDAHKNMKLITRIHGYDLRHEEFDGGRQPFKGYMDPLLDNVFFISKEGLRYYLTNYGMTSNNRYDIQYLGAPKAEQLYHHKRDKDCFHIVTCSATGPGKRLPLLIDALATNKEYKIKWTHIGDGVERPDIEAYAKKKLDNNSYVTYEFTGFITRDNIYKYYQETGADCFINISKLEGLPVSIMEALAFGAPIIATNVGANDETIVDNGVLLPEDPSTSEIWNAVKSLIEMDDEQYMSYCDNSYNLWRDKFDAVLNAERFVDKLDNLYFSSGVN